MTCDICDKRVRLRSGNLVARPLFPPGRICGWAYMCDKCLDQDGRVTYWIELGDFLDDPLDWLAQLAEKTWFDAGRFVSLFSALRDHGALKELKARRKQ